MVDAVSDLSTEVASTEYMLYPPRNKQLPELGGKGAGPMRDMKVPKYQNQHSVLPSNSVIKLALFCIEHLNILQEYVTTICFERECVAGGRKRFIASYAFAPVCRGLFSKSYTK